MTALIVSGNGRADTVKQIEEDGESTVMTVTTESKWRTMQISIKEAHLIIEKYRSQKK